VAIPMLLLLLRKRQLRLMVQGITSLVLPFLLDVCRQCLYLWTFLLFRYLLDFSRFCSDFHLHSVWSSGLGVYD